ncbi:hypothetical protein [Luteolibacter sp. LG18]|uniref:hypothetical protein n=1 Tax=Luteolibacter sp. LG18 TaxID=2819286 RepID=UPI002B2FA87B|nr:hypothetical protein llg_28330 [Luteolibacter sp. LG18]
MRSSILLLLGILTLPLSVASAEPVPPPVAPSVPVQPIPAQPVPRQRIRLQNNPGQPGEADRNLSIALTGKVGENREIDVSLTGTGPRFESDSMLADGSLLTVRYDVTQTDKGTLVNYSLGLQVEVKSGNNSQYRSLAFSGTVLCTGDKPVEIYANGAQKLALGVATTKAAEADKSK